MQQRAPSHITLSLPALVVVLVGFSGCLSMCYQIDPEGPEPLPPPAHQRAALPSTMSVPIAIPVDELSALVNQIVKQNLYRVRDKQIKGGLFKTLMDLDIRRNGSIYTRTRDGKIINHLPLIVEGRVRIPPGIWRPFSSTFTIHAITDVNLDEDWGTVAHTQPSFTWETTPYIKVLGIKVGVKGTAEKALTRELARLAPKIDSLIEKHVNFRQRVVQLWESLSEPVAIGKQPPVWLTIRPVEMYFSPGISRNDTLIFGLLMHAFVETIVGNKPEVPVLGALPPLYRLPDSLAADPSRGFQVNLPVSITYDDARALLSKTMVGKAYEVKEQVAITVDEIKLYGHGPRLVARVDFKANVAKTIFGTRGRVFLTGTPVYDAASQTVRVDSFDYDVHSRNALAEAADWIFREDFLEQTRARLVFPLADDITAAKQRLEEALRDRPLGKNIILNGTIDELVPGDLYLVEDGINVDIYARGRLTVRVHSLEHIERKKPAASAN